MNPLVYRHVDVFSKTPLSGNGLTVFLNCESLSAAVMQKIAQEMRQFESIFLFPTSDAHHFSARIFTMEEELDFAGHPILGAACVLHEKIGEAPQEMEWVFELPHKIVPVKTIRRKDSFLAIMEQGQPQFDKPLSQSQHSKLLNAFNLSEQEIDQSLPLQVVSTGLPYLIIPLRKGLDRARITSPELEHMLASIGAKFCYLLDIPNCEGRTWDNAGKVEDIATGSAAGPVGAYLVQHGIVQPNTEIVLHQGRFAGRPSQIFIEVAGTREEIHSVKVSGEVCMVATGTFDNFLG